MASLRKKKKRLLLFSIVAFTGKKKSLLSQELKNAPYELIDNDAIGEIGVAPSNWKTVLKYIKGHGLLNGL